MGNARFFGLFVISAGVHAAALFTLGWSEPSAPSAGGALRVALASPPSSQSVDLVTPTAAPVPRPIAERPQQLTAPSRVVTTQAREARPHVAPVAPPQQVVRIAASRPIQAALAAVQPADAATKLAVRSGADLSPVSVEAGDAGTRLAAATAPTVNPAEPALSRLVASVAVDSAGGHDAQRRSAGNQLLAALQDHFAYPLRARRRGWEGDVVLGVDLDEGGVIAEVRLLASSGYGALDRAAIASMRAVGALEHSLFGRLTVEVPVRYRLIN